MKNYFIVLACVFCSIANSQSLEKKIPQQFDSKFKTKEEKEDLVRLRDFLELKDAEYARVRSALEDINMENINSSDSLTFVGYKSQLEKFLQKKPKDGDSYERNEINDKIHSICQIASAIRYSEENGMKKQTYYVSLALDNVDSWIRNVGRKSMMTVSCDNINKDRDAAAKAIQLIYNVEKGDQEYKTEISLYYAIIIFALIIISFLFLFKKSSPEIGNDFLNGNGLQFIALFAIIISTILFGILGILEGKELSAILSGIAGFILGKGLNVNLTKTTPAAAGSATSTNTAKAGKTK